MEVDDAEYTDLSRQSLIADDLGEVTDDAEDGTGEEGSATATGSLSNGFGQDNGENENTSLV